MLADANELLRLIKRSALEAVEAGKPVNVCYGKVMSLNPLKVSVDQKLILGAAQLVLCRNVTDHRIFVSLNPDDGWVTEEAGLHTHDIKASRFALTVHNGLKIGDDVLLIRVQDGQKFLVVDRI